MKDFETKKGMKSEVAGGSAVDLKSSVLGGFGYCILLYHVVFAG